MNSKIRLLDVVALTCDIPDKNLWCGQVGTIVELYTDGQFEVEFSDEEGCTYGLETLKEDQLMVLRYRQEQVA